MKHAGSSALDQLEPLIAALRDVSGLRERSRGVFYRGGRAFLHFHEDPAGLFVDVRFDDDFKRLRVTSEAERAIVLDRVRAVCEETMTL